MIHRDGRDGVLVLRMAHGKANAFDTEVVADLERALDDAADARAIVLTGTGTIFSAGVDLFRVVQGGREYIERFLPALGSLFVRVFEHPAPIVAAVNGHAIAGGCVLACACDRRVAARGSGRIGLPELIVGVPLPTSALEIVRFAARGAVLSELIYRGRTAEPDEACGLGLVDEVVEPAALLDRARDAALELAAIPAATFRLTKRALRQPALDRIRQEPSSSERDLINVWAAPDTLEAVRRYLERTLKRPV